MNARIAGARCHRFAAFVDAKAGMGNDYGGSRITQLGVMSSDEIFCEGIFWCPRTSSMKRNEDGECPRCDSNQQHRKCCQREPVNHRLISNVRLRRQESLFEFIESP